MGKKSGKLANRGDDYFESLTRYVIRMYHVPVRTPLQSVLVYIRRQGLLHAGDRLGVAVSGGADSVALLRIMLELRQELGIVLSIVHFNHKLRGAEADTDEKFVTQLAHRHDLELHVSSSNVAAHARSQHLSLEAAARQLRYQYFRQLLEKKRLNRIATGHTLDDQAETVLLRIIRGAGTRGLAGVYPQLLVYGSQFSVIRPLLQTRRKLLETYLGEIGQDWREDSSNRDLRHARNRVRHGVRLPFARRLTYRSPDRTIAGVARHGASPRVVPAGEPCPSALLWFDHDDR